MRWENFTKNLRNKYRVTGLKTLVYVTTDNLITKHVGIMQRLVDYFTELFNGTSDYSSPNLPTFYSITSWNEEKAVDIGKLKNNKSSE